MQDALPAFVDSDRETFQVDARKIEAKLSAQTRCIMPVHLGGNPANMDGVLEVAKKHKLTVIEDACQAHTGEWRHRRVGTLGELGCFSFQASKNLNSGKGWAILTNDPAYHEFCKSFQNQGRGPVEEAVWFFQTMLLGPRRDMDDIAEAVRKIQKHAAELVRA